MFSCPHIPEDNGTAYAAAAILAYWGGFLDASEVLRLAPRSARWTLKQVEQQALRWRSILTARTDQLEAELRDEDS